MAKAPNTRDYGKGMRSFEFGGGVTNDPDTRYDNFPESPDNIEDRRGDRNTNNHAYEYGTTTFGSSQTEDKPSVLRAKPRTIDPNQTIGSVFDDQQSRLFASQRKRAIERGVRKIPPTPLNDKLEEDMGLQHVGKQP